MYYDVVYCYSFYATNVKTTLLKNA